MIEIVLGPNRHHLREACSIVEEFCKKRNIKFLAASAGLFVFAQLCPEATEEDEKRFKEGLQTHGVTLACGTSYHCKERGWFRICFAVERVKLCEALRRLDMMMR